MLINAITSDGFNPNIKWIHKQTDEIDKKLCDYTKLLGDDIRFFEYKGYSWIYADKPLLTELLNGGAVSTISYEHQILNVNICQLEGWHYVNKLHDIEFILEQTRGFHDSVLKELTYLSGAYVDNKNNMHCTDSIRQVAMRFDSQWCRSVEMVFEGVVALNLRPYSDNESSYLYDASFFIQNETVFFFDSQINEIDNSYEGTWIASYGLRWRFYGENHKFFIK